MFNDCSHFLSIHENPRGWGCSDLAQKCHFFSKSNNIVINVIIMHDFARQWYFFLKWSTQEDRLYLDLTCVLLFQSKLLATYFDVFLRLILWHLLFYWLLLTWKWYLSECICISDDNLPSPENRQVSVTHRAIVKAWSEGTSNDGLVKDDFSLLRKRVLKLNLVPWSIDFHVFPVMGNPPNICWVCYSEWLFLL